MELSSGYCQCCVIGSIYISLEFNDLSGNCCDIVEHPGNVSVGLIIIYYNRTIGESNLFCYVCAVCITYKLVRPFNVVYCTCSSTFGNCESKCKNY